MRARAGSRCASAARAARRQEDESAHAAGARRRPRVRVGLAAPVRDRGARRDRRRDRGRGRRSWWWATTAPRATWRATWARGWRHGAFATTPRGASRTSPTWRRPRISSACAWPRSTRCSAQAAAAAIRRRPSQPVVVVSAVALSEKVPDPQLRPHSFTLRVGELLDLDECAAELVERGLRARRPGRGARAVRAARRPAGCLPGDRGPGGAGRHVRRGDRIAALVLDVHAALARGRRARSRSRRRQSSRSSIGSSRRWPLRRSRRRSSAAGAGEDSERPDIAELLPVERFGALLELVGAETELVVAAEEELEPVLDDHWSDVCAAFGDEDAHHLYVSPRERPRDAGASALGSGCRRCPAARRSSCARSRRTRPRARWARPSPSSRSSCARATGPWWRSLAAARVSARRTTWHG